MALLLTSHVSASMVGGANSRFVLNAAGIDSMLVPTVLLGRHPGWGEPGGGPVEQEMFQSVLSGIADNGMLALTDVVLTGYFADVGQIYDSGAVIDVVRNSPRHHNGLHAYAKKPLVIVDPIMGDAPDGLYVSNAIAAGIIDQLVSRADLITPNVFELGRITRRTLTDTHSMLRAARSLDCPVLVSSVPCGGQIGVMYIDKDEAWLVQHDRFPDVPKGTGDLLTAAFTAAIINGKPAREALEESVSATASVIARAREWKSPELPIVAGQQELRDPHLKLSAVSLD
ncbi:PfkB family carbohydrate kinase [Maricaulis sp. MIT060901]